MIVSSAYIFIVSVSKLILYNKRSSKTVPLQVRW